MYCESNKTQDRIIYCMCLTGIHFSFEYANHLEMINSLSKALVVKVFSLV